MPPFMNRLANQKHYMTILDNQPWLLYLLYSKVSFPMLVLGLTQTDFYFAKLMEVHSELESLRKLLKIKMNEAT